MGEDREDIVGGGGTGEGTRRRRGEMTDGWQRAMAEELAVMDKWRDNLKDRSGGETTQTWHGS